MRHNVYNIKSSKDFDLVSFLPSTEKKEEQSPLTGSVLVGPTPGELPATSPGYIYVRGYSAVLFPSKTDHGVRLRPRIKIIRHRDEGTSSEIHSCVFRQIQNASPCENSMKMLLYDGFIQPASRYKYGLRITSQRDVRVDVCRLGLGQIFFVYCGSSIN